jgi:hypothetical protein
MPGLVSAIACEAGVGDTGVSACDYLLVVRLGFRVRIDFHADAADRHKDPVRLTIGGHRMREPEKAAGEFPP